MRSAQGVAIITEINNAVITCLQHDTLVVALADRYPEPGGEQHGSFGSQRTSSIQAINTFTRHFRLDQPLLRHAHKQHRQLGGIGE
ncbi:hypothetical protein D3C73_1276300 [compost metagenome]